MSVMSSIEDKMKLKPIIGRNFRKVEVKKDCKLREAIEYDKNKLIFKRGHAYYEFTHEKET